MTLSRDSRQVLLGIAIGVLSIALIAGVYVAGQRSVVPVRAAAADTGPAPVPHPDPVSEKVQPRTPSIEEVDANAKRMIAAQMAGDTSIPLPGRQDLKPPIEPMMGWREIRTMSVDLRPGNAVMLFDLAPQQPSILRYRVRSANPITVGYMPTALREPFQQGKFNAGFVLGGSPCVEHGISSRTIECASDKDDARTVVLVDERAAPNQVVDLLGRALVKKFTGATLPDNTAAAVNHIEVLISMFACVEHCANKADQEVTGQIDGRVMAYSELQQRSSACRVAQSSRDEINQCLKGVVDSLAPLN